MRCPKCGNMMPVEGLRFCIYCGTPFKQKNVFLCCSRSGLAQTSLAAAVLEAQGMRTFTALMEDVAAADAAALEKLDACDAFVLALCGDDAGDDRRVRVLRAALERKKEICLVTLTGGVYAVKDLYGGGLGLGTDFFAMSDTQGLADMLRAFWEEEREKPDSVPQQGYTMPQQGYAMPQQGYTMPQQGYAMPQQGYAAPPQGYAAPPQGHAAPPQGHTIPLGYAMPQPAAAAAPQPKRGRRLGLPSFGTEETREKTYKTDFSVLTDSAVRPGASAGADVLMYKKGRRRDVEKILKAAGGKKTEAARSMSSAAVRHGTRVTVLLTSPDAAVESGSETQLWLGETLVFSFRFRLPEDYAKKQADFTCEVLFDGIHVTRLYFTVRLNAPPAPVRPLRRDTKKAFVSYSHQDKQQVVDRLLSLQTAAPKLRFWMDSQSMQAGDLWRSEIRTAIRSADSFLLFWSRHAKASSEVEKEWRYALQLTQDKKEKAQGTGFITPVPLESPSACPPPAELAELHFGDPSFDAGVDAIADVRFLTNKKKFKNLRFM